MHCCKTLRVKGRHQRAQGCCRSIVSVALRCGINRKVKRDEDKVAHEVGPLM